MINDPTKPAHCPDCQFPASPVDEDGNAYPILTARDHCRSALADATEALERAAAAAGELSAVDCPAYSSVEVRREMVADAIKAAAGSVDAALRRLERP